jgi:ABC-type amino acid transport system permease subunit
MNKSACSFEQDKIFKNIPCRVMEFFWFFSMWQILSYVAKYLMTCHQIFFHITIFILKNQ